MQMHVIGLSEKGEIQDSSYTTRLFSKISSGNICAVRIHAANDVTMLTERFGCESKQFLLVDDNGLQALRSRDKQIVSLGQINSTEILVRNNEIISPSLDLV